MSTYIKKIIVKSYLLAPVKSWCFRNSITIVVIKPKFLFWLFKKYKLTICYDSEQLQVVKGLDQILKNQ